MKRTRQTTESFIKKANVIHNNFYDYSKTIYTKADEKLLIICPLHGIFEQNPYTHLTGKGCAKCGFERRKDVKRSTKEIFVKKAIEIHGNKFNYSHVNYTNSYTKVDIECPLHGIFKQKPNSHLNGSGCKQCSLEDVHNTFSTSGFIKASKGKKCLLYVLHCFNNEESFYKIGITTRSVKERYDCKKAMPYNYEILKEIYGQAEDIWNLEVKLKRNLTSKYTPKTFFDGCIKECFHDYTEILETLY